MTILINRLIFISILLWGWAHSQDRSISADRILEHIKYLSSDKLKGREPGTPGSKMAGRYIEKEWRKNGLVPAGTRGFKQPFQFTGGVYLSGYNRLKINETRKTFRVKNDFIPLGFSKTGSFDMPVVFAGYGFGTEDSVAWNDYSDIDVSGKWVLVFRGSPDGSGPHSAFADHMSIRKKYNVAKENGAGGVLLVNPYEDDDLDGFIELRLGPSSAEGDIPIIHISQEIGDQLFDEPGKARLLQSVLDGERRSVSRSTDRSISATIGLKAKKVKGSNIVGLLEGVGKSDELIIVGAHMDHLGRGGRKSGSLSTESDLIHNGADDNASGTAGLIELARYFSNNKLNNDILFIAFDAEEKGLLGSKYYVKNPSIDLENVRLMINLDMIGRMEDSSATVSGTGTSPLFEPLLDSLRSFHNLSLSYNKAGFGPSDHSSFYAKDIPVLFFFTGIHEDYHKPSDDWDKINESGIKMILDLITETVIHVDRLDTKPQFTEAGPKERMGGRRSFKVTFGIIPSYVGGGKGLKLDGVQPDGPADNAGILKGDIIIEIEGKEIKDIYDYMHRLGTLKKGQEVSVKIMREEESISLIVRL